MTKTDELLNEIKDFEYVYLSYLILVSEVYDIEYGEGNFSNLKRFNNQECFSMYLLYI